jgi:hypothetical protein
MGAKGDAVLGEKFRAYAEKSGKTPCGMVEEMKFPLTFYGNGQRRGERIISGYIHGNNPLGDNAVIVEDYLRRMKAL